MVSVATSATDHAMRRESTRDDTAKISRASRHRLTSSQAPREAQPSYPLTCLDLHSTLPPTSHASSPVLIRHLHIKNLKLLHDFELSFVDDQGKPRMWTVIIG